MAKHGATRHIRCIICNVLAGSSLTCSPSPSLFLALIILTLLFLPQCFCAVFDIIAALARIDLPRLDAPAIQRGQHRASASRRCNKFVAGTAIQRELIGSDIFETHAQANDRSRISVAWSFLWI